MRRTLEAIFRRPIRLFLVIVLFTLVGLGVAYILPRNYSASASLWALRRYQVISDTGPESDLLATPAETQVTALTELLQSRTFTLAVARAAKLDTAFTAKDPQTLEEDMFNDLAKNVHATTQGYNTYLITYSHHDPHIAQQVIQCVITQYAMQSQGFSVVEAQHLLLSYESQLTKAKDNADKAAQAQTQYINDHPNISRNDLLNDPNYALLDAQAQQTRTTLQDIQTHIATLNQQISNQGTSSDGFFKILDKPILPRQPESRMKQLLIGGGAGLGLALLACAFYLAIMIRRDRTIYSVRDIQKITALPVSLQIPLLQSPTLALLGKDSMQKAF